MSSILCVGYRQLSPCSLLHLFLYLLLSTASFAQIENALSTVASDTVASDKAVPTQVIEQLHQQLLSTMQSGGDFLERYQQLEIVVNQSFKISTISRVSLGRTWKTIDDEQKQQFKDLLMKTIVSTYAQRFDSYNKQQFTILDTTEPKPKHWVVKTQITKSNGDSIPINYYFKQHKIFNVVADGVSDLSLRRSDYSAIIKKSGFQGLIDRLNEELEPSLR